MRIKKHFDVRQPPEVAASILKEEETLTGLFANSETEIVARDGDRLTVLSRYTLIGQEGEATFHFDYAQARLVTFEKVCNGRVWKQLSGSVRCRPLREGTRVEIEMDGRTKGLVPEFTIKLPLQEQLDQMTRGLKRRIETSD